MLSNKFLTAFCFLLAFLIFSTIVVAQEKPKQNVQNTADISQSQEWHRLVSDNGELAVEMPAEYEFFSDENGFLINDSGGNGTLLKQVKFITSYHDQTLMRVESYRLQKPKDGLTIMFERDRLDGKKTDISREEWRGKQITSQDEKSYSITQYLASKTHLYVIVTATRGEETATMKRFLASIKLNSAPEATQSNNALKTFKFSNLKNSSFEFVAKSRGEREKNESRNSAIKSDSDNSAPNKTKDDNSHPMIIIFQPAASFSPEARANATIRLRLNFSASGRISKVEVISPSDNGLIRQATFAALRIKFLPQEKNGQPVSITKVMEYRFRVG